MRKTIYYCPKCKKASIEMFAGLVTGQYHCTSCGYTGTLIIEKEIK